MAQLISKNYYILDVFTNIDVIVRASDFKKAWRIYCRYIQLNQEKFTKLTVYMNPTKSITSEKLRLFTPYWEKGSYIIKEPIDKIPGKYSVIEETSEIKIQDLEITNETVIL